MQTALLKRNAKKIGSPSLLYKFLNYWCNPNQQYFFECVSEGEDSCEKAFNLAKCFKTADKEVKRQIYFYIEDHRFMFMFSFQIADSLFYPPKTNE